MSGFVNLHQGTPLMAWIGAAVRYDGGEKSSPYSIVAFFWDLDILDVGLESLKTASLVEQVFADASMFIFTNIIHSEHLGANKMEMKLDKERIKVLREKAQIYFRDELDESIGDLKADLIVEFFIKQIGPQIYNQAISDAYTFIQDKLIDLEGTLYIPE